MKHLRVFAPTLLLLLLLAALLCVSAGPLPPPLPEPSSLAPNATRLLDGDLQNSTRYETMQTLSIESDVSVTWSRAVGCPLSTCALSNLGSRLQGGDETAGAATRDSDGFGRK